MGQINPFGFAPESLAKSITEAVELVEASPTHHLDWRHRREMYKTFGSASDPTVLKVRGWLAVLSAQYVLPLFEKRPLATLISDDPNFEGVPRRAIDAAINMLHDSADQQVVAYVHNDAYMTFGTWGDGDPSFSMKATTAGFCSYKAMLEVMGNLEPFALAESFHKGTKPGLPQDNSRTDWISGDEFTDTDWAEIAACGDAAGCAAIAYACDPNSLDQCDPEKLKAFWTWWLLEAIPKAWAIVVRG